MCIIGKEEERRDITKRGAAITDNPHGFSVDSTAYINNVIPLVVAYYPLIS